jgi:CRP/FNR family transcriptional regulator
VRAVATGSAETVDTAALLHRVPLFATLAEEDLGRVADVAELQRFDAGAVVLREGDAGNTCYVIRSGEARAVREQADGRSVTLARFGPGDIFGELAMLDDEVRSATVETLEETEAVAIRGSDMRRLLREHPEIAIKLVVALGRRLRDTNELLLIDHIAEFADSRVRTLQRQGSLVAVPDSYGVGRWLYTHWRNNGNAVYTFGCSLLAIGLSGLWAWVAKEPLLFPSLGATAFLIFETPMAEVSSPRNTVVGHTVGIGAGVAALAIFGLFNTPSVFVTGMTTSRIGAIALAVALTGGVLRLVRCAHPPAGATTIIVASGLLGTAHHRLVYVWVGVLLLTAAGWTINRLAGVPAPIWAAPR